MDDSGRHGAGTREDFPVPGAATRRDWEELPADPDLFEDLGYELLDLEAYDTNGDRVLFLPPDEEMLRDEAFIVADKDAVRGFGE